MSHRRPAPLFGVVLALGLLPSLFACGSTTVASTTPSAQISASPDAQVIKYRHVIDVDMNAVNFALYNVPCNTRQTCTYELGQVEIATEALLSDLSSKVAPAGVGPTVEPLRSAAQQFEEQVDGDLVVVQQPNSNYTAATPTVKDLFLAAAALECWPSKPVNFGGEGGYSCS